MAHAPASGLHSLTMKFDSLNRSVYCVMFYPRSVVLASLRTLSIYSTTVGYDSLCARRRFCGRTTSGSVLLSTWAPILNFLCRPRTKSASSLHHLLFVGIATHLTCVNSPPAHLLQHVNFSSQPIVLWYLHCGCRHATGSSDKTRL